MMLMGDIILENLALEPGEYSLDGRDITRIERAREVPVTHEISTRETGE
jgi:hypothetical protein